MDDLPLPTEEIQRIRASFDQQAPSESERFWRAANMFAKAMLDGLLAERKS